MPYRLATLFAILATTSAFASLYWTNSLLDVRSKVETTTSVATTPSLADEVSPIEGMNQTIQKRFRALTKFGISRLPVVHLAARFFKPETALEHAVVADFKRNGWEVSLYLVGREVLTSEVSEAELEFDEWMNPRVINGPVLITALPRSKDLPSGQEIREFGRTALIKADSGGTFTTTSGRWKIEARPVRADRQACLKCHASEGASADPAIWEKEGRPLRVGDVLGVVLYLYARNPK